MTGEAGAMIDVHPAEESMCKCVCVRESVWMSEWGYFCIEDSKVNLWQCGSSVHSRSAGELRYHYPAVCTHTYTHTHTHNCKCHSWVYIKALQGQNVPLCTCYWKWFIHSYKQYVTQGRHNNFVNNSSDFKYISLYVCVCVCVCIQCLCDTL